MRKYRDKKNPHFYYDKNRDKFRIPHSAGLVQRTYQRRGSPTGVVFDYCRAIDRRVPETDDRLTLLGGQCGLIRGAGRIAGTPSASAVRSFPRRDVPETMNENVRDPITSNAHRDESGPHDHSLNGSGDRIASRGD